MNIRSKTEESETMYGSASRHRACALLHSFHQERGDAYDG